MIGRRETSLCYQIRDKDKVVPQVILEKRTEVMVQRVTSHVPINKHNSANKRHSKSRQSNARERTGEDFNERRNGRAV